MATRKQATASNKAPQGHVRVRYAPSPTGDPHVGNIRTALFDWLLVCAWPGALLEARTRGNRHSGAWYSCHFNSIMLFGSESFGHNSRSDLWVTIRADLGKLWLNKC